MSLVPPSSTDVEPAELVFSDEDILEAVEIIEAERPRRFRAGMGFCENLRCEAFLRGTFVFNTEGNFTCPTCKKEGPVEYERAICDREFGQLIGVIKIQYCFDPYDRKYHEMLILRDQNLGTDVGTFTLFCPNTKTEKQALRRGEPLFPELNNGFLFEDHALQDIPKAHNYTISLDEPLEKLKQSLESWRLQVQDNPFYVMPVFSQGSEKTPNGG